MSHLWENLMQRKEKQQDAGEQCEEERRWSFLKEGTKRLNKLMTNWPNMTAKVDVTTDLR